MQRLSNSYHVNKCKISFPALHTSYVRAIKTGLIS